MEKIKKILLTLTLLLFVSVSAFTFNACGCEKEDGPATMAIKNVFAMSMVTATNYLDASSTPKTISELDSETEDTIKEYTQMFEGLLSDGIHPTEGKVSTIDGKYFGVYTEKLILQIENETYIMYYNEVIEGTETEIDNDEIKTGTTSFLYGVVEKIVGTDATLYSVVGSREIESETKKDVTVIESELKLIFTTETLEINSTSKLDDINLRSFDDYVVIEQEVEEDEIEFEYTTKTPAMSSPKTVEIEFENEDDEYTLEIKIKTGSTKTKYEITKVNDTKYSVKLKSDGNKIKYYVEKGVDDWSITNA